MEGMFDYGSEYFEEAKKFYSKFVFDLFMLNTQGERARYATETAQEIQEWRNRWLRDPKARKYTPLVTAVEMLVTKEISGA